jgi:hypothetical protein
MTPAEIAAWADAVWDAFAVLGYGADNCTKLTAIALQEKLRYETKKTESLGEWRSGGL